MSQVPFCGFLKEYNHSLYMISQKVDELVYVEATSSVIQGRKFAESLLKEIYKMEIGVEDERFYPKLYDMLNELYREDIFGRDLQVDFDFLRFNGNKAVHEQREHSQITALKVHRKVHKLAGWYAEVYGSPDFETPEYIEPKPTPSIDEDYIQEIIKQHISKFTGSKITEGDSQQNSFEIKGDLGTDESYLIRELNRLKASSQEALENVGNFSAFKNYLHVERNIQFNLEEELQSSNQKEKKLILLSGSVGDGKSHLLSYLNENKPDLIKDYTIINDATESSAPNKNSMETLKEKLSGFSDQHLTEGDEKVILAINLGVLNNFISYDHNDLTFTNLEQFINDSNLFTDEVTEVFERNQFSIINFSDYQPFQLMETKVFSKYFDEILYKVTNKDSLNPFYQAYQKDLKNNVYTAVHFNYELLSNQSTKKELNKLICNLILEDKMVISTRSFLNFIADILVPTETNLKDIRIENMTEFERIKYTLPSLLFNRQGRSDLIDGMQKYDPIHQRSRMIDEIINSIYSTQNFNKVIESFIKDDNYKKVFEPFSTLLDSEENTLEDESFQSLTKSFIRSAYLTDPLIQEELERPAMQQYVRYLYGYNRGGKGIIRDIYESVRKAIFAWKGSPKKGYIYINNMTEAYRVAQKIDFIPSPNQNRKSTKEELDSFNTTLNLRFMDQSKKETVELEIDYPLFELLSKVSNGYRPNKKDYEDGLAFITFMDQLINISKTSDLLIHFHGEKELFTLEKDFIGSFAFEKVEN
ncbi:DNA phosphorothioation-dependent restriction protein DptF [Virgibacillus sediminis]|uniref:DNA phosphorothioation-dependent restriction protein DptF n=1 Tax=Virgibacillus sediminis TaxID=202260 RepID=A0ABV7A515_9BACI